MQSVDVVVIGAGISGIDAAYQLTKRCGGKSFVVLERRKSFGGTWDLFKYPGLRSDSDMYTFGYGFRPWTNAKQIAPGADILAYLQAVIEENNLHQHIRFEHHVVQASWSSSAAKWDLLCEDGKQFRCKFLIAGAGYYDQDAGYEPEFRGAGAFRAAGARIVHPQKWEEDGPVDYEGKQVVVIGSGATAVTLIPAMAEKAAHVTMLQRSPTYILPIPAEDAQAKRLAARLPASLVHMAMRWRTLLVQLRYFRQLGKNTGESNKKQFLVWMRQCVSKKVMNDEEFNKNMVPSYNPWEQRLCLCPDGDFYRAIHQRRASIVTDTIEEFDERGLRLTSGGRVDADVIVTATGLQWSKNYPMATMKTTVDGVPYSAQNHKVYNGCMLSGVPNFGFVTGYFNASWTLKADIVCAYLCDLINHMDQLGYSHCSPTWDPTKSEVLDIKPLKSGYIQRAMHLMPAFGTKKPWQPLASYVQDSWDLRWRPIEDGTLTFQGGLRSRL